MKKCPKCNAESPDDAVRCFCLYRFTKYDTAPLENGMSPLENERKKNEENKIKGQYVTAVAAIIVIFSYLLIEALYIVPNSKVIYEAAGKELTYKARFVLNMSNFICHNKILSIIVVLLLMSGLIWLVRYIKTNKSEFLVLITSVLGLILYGEITIFLGSIYNVFVK